MSEGRLGLGMLCITSEEGDASIEFSNTEGMRESWLWGWRTSGGLLVKLGLELFYSFYNKILVWR